MLDKAGVAVRHPLARMCQHSRREVKFEHAAGKRRKIGGVLGLVVTTVPKVPIWKRACPVIDRPGSCYLRLGAVLQTVRYIFSPAFPL